MMVFEGDDSCEESTCNVNARKGSTFYRTNLSSSRKNKGAGRPQRPVLSWVWTAGYSLPHHSTAAGGAAGSREEEVPEEACMHMLPSSVQV
eukprot:1134539-Pelagomonas_calceolata.AAC.1